MEFTWDTLASEARAQTRWKWFRHRRRRLFPQRIAAGDIDRWAGAPSGRLARGCGNALRCGVYRQLAPRQRRQRLFTDGNVRHADRPCPAEHIVKAHLQASDVCGNQTDPWIQFIFHVDTCPRTSWCRRKTSRWRPQRRASCAVDALVPGRCVRRNHLVLCHLAAETYCPGSSCCSDVHRKTCANSSSWVHSSWWKT